MVFQLDPRTTAGTKSIVIMLLSSASIHWASANGIMCCNEPDVQLTVACANGIAHLQWKTSVSITFGSIIAYNCNTNATCHGGNKKRLRRSEAAINNSHMLFAHNLINSEFGNATCWFWIKILDEINNDERGCSPMHTCSVEPATTVLMLSSSTTTSDHIMPSSSTPGILPISSSSIPSSSSSPLSSSVSLTSYSQTATVTASIITTNIYATTTAASATASVSATNTATASAAASATAADTATATAAITSYSISSVAVSSVQPQQSSSPDLYLLLLYITLCCAAIIFLLVSICFCCCCWRKYKGKQSENYQIKDMCFEDLGELAKESDSETETLTNAGMGDDVSITDDHPYMLRKILHSDHDVLSLDPSILTVNEADDGSVASHYRTGDGGVDCSHYCGSDGQCSV